MFRISEVNVSEMTLRISEMPFGYVMTLRLTLSRNKRDAKEGKFPLVGLTATLGLKLDLVQLLLCIWTIVFTYNL